MASHGHDRIELVRRALKEADLDALVCSFPSNVLMLTGYWPVVGTSVAVVSAEGWVIAIVPEDEEELAQRSWAEVHTFSPTSLDKVTTASEMLVQPLRQALRDLGAHRGKVGYGDGPVSQPASYSAMHIYGGGMSDVLQDAADDAELSDAEQIIHRLRRVKTAYEIECIREACAVAASAFEIGRGGLRVPLPSRRLNRGRLVLGGAGETPPRQPARTPAVQSSGLREVDVAAIFEAPLSTAAPDDEERAGGFMFCMSGPNAAQAYGAYARSRFRSIRSGDLVLVHCNSYLGGYCTDITRTYAMGPPDLRQRKLYGAVFAARDAALRTIRPGVRARDVDAAARRVLTQRGYGDHFKHPAGHGVGFGAIDSTAQPRLHPKSPDVLEPGMVFNLEPAIYIEGYGGIRHCDVVAVTERGAEVLTPFQSSDIQELTIALR